MQLYKIFKIVRVLFFAHNVEVLLQAYRLSNWYFAEPRHESPSAD